MSLQTALVLTHSPSSENLLSSILQERGLKVHASPQAGENYDLIFCDFSPFAEMVLTTYAGKSLIVLMTPYDTLPQTVEALPRGAFHYLLQPFSAQAIDSTFSRAQETLRKGSPYKTPFAYELLRKERERLQKENQSLRQEISQPQPGFQEKLIAQSSLMRKILVDVGNVAKSQASVFLCGESGTGKEVIAKAIHEQSFRTSRPFIRVNCAAMASNLLESEFFGHEKGAFTGALHRRLGRFELAHTGTLLLDEVSEIPLELQAKLLRAVQEMEFERVGGSESVQVDVRLIATSNRQMKERVMEGKFREDLYYRLNVVPIHLPPLRERKEDILPLAKYFLAQLSAENQRPCKILSERACQQLLAYRFPGNIRELANMMERALVLYPNPCIEPEHLALEPTVFVHEESSSLSLKELEKQHILRTLANCRYHREKTAKQLGINVRTLRNKLLEYET